MTELLQRLIDALRDELKQYGEMLARLEQQQEHVIRREADDLLRSVSDIESQGACIQRAREHRELCRREVAMASGLIETAPFVEMMPRLAAEYQPLISALLEENNDLLRRVRERSRQNHLLLSRSLKMMQQLISSLSPDAGPLYSERGNMAGKVVPVRSYYEAVG